MCMSLTSFIQKTKQREELLGWLPQTGGITVVSANASYTYGHDLNIDN